MKQQMKKRFYYGEKVNKWKAKSKVVMAILACALPIYANADTKDVLIKYDKNSYLKELEITPEIDAELKAHKESVLYVVKRNEHNYKKIFADSIVRAKAEIEAIENEKQNIKRLEGLQGQKYSSDADREFISRLIELYVEPDDIKKSLQDSYDQTMHTSSISDMVKATKAIRSLNKLQENAQKELKKNKIGENTFTLLSLRTRTLDKRNIAYTKLIEVLENWQQYDIATLKTILWFDPNTVDEYFACNDTILNPYNPIVIKEIVNEQFRQNPSEYAHGIDKSFDSEWAWISQEKGERMSENFPHRMEYYHYSSHPDLRIVGNASYKPTPVYDKNGTLVAVVNPDLGITADADRNSREEIGKLVARFAYENNDYDIQSYDAKTLHYVKNQLGLEALTAKEKAASKAAADGMAKATINYMRDNAKYGSKTKKGRQAQEKNAVDFFGAMLSDGFSGYYSSTGDNWFEQIRIDYRNVYVIERERIDGLTFRSVYADKDANRLFEVIVRFDEDAYDLKKTFQLKKCPKTEDAEQVAVVRRFLEKVEDKSENQIYSGNQIDLEKIKVFDDVEESPSFPGDVHQWLRDNLVYPTAAKERDILKCSVPCEFIIGPDGTVSNVKVRRSSGEPSIDKEAIRLLNAMPKWNPGKQSSKPVYVRYRLSVLFQFN